MCWILDSDGLDFESNGVWVGFRFFFFFLISRLDSGWFVWVGVVVPLWAW